MKVMEGVVGIVDKKGLNFFAVLKAGTKEDQKSL